MKYDKTLYPFESKWVEIDGINIHYVDEGKGQIILFSHAAIGSSFMYRRFIHTLSKHFRCIALDFPGFGMSTQNPETECSIVGQSQILISFIEVLELDDIIVLGHDTGGPSIFSVCTKHHHLVSGIILTDTVIFPTTEYPKIHRMLGILGSSPIEWINSKTNFLTRLTINKGVMTRKLTQDEKAIYYQMTATPGRRSNMISVLSSLKKNEAFMVEVKSGFENQLITKPALLIYGEKDPVKELGIPSRIHSMMPNSELYLIKGEGHFPHEGQPERMSEIIFQWIKNLKQKR